MDCMASDRINMPQMKKDKEMKWGDYQCKFYNHIACLKWYGNKSVMLLGNHLEEITSTSTMQRRWKDSSSKIPVNYPNDIKLYNSKMDGVGLMDQQKSAYQLDRRSKFRFNLCLFFDLFDVALVNSYIVYKKLGNKDLTLKEFKICIALKLIASFVSQKLSCLNYWSRCCRSSVSIVNSEHSSHVFLVFLLLTGYCRKKPLVPEEFFFNFYLATQWPTLGHYLGDSLTHLMLINIFLRFWA